MKKIRKHLIGVFSFLLCGAVLLGTALFPHPREEATAEKCVVRVWNVDTFEGGKGSRAAFLKKVASRAEKKKAGVYYMIGAYTVEGAKAALREGDCPDMISFGLGLEEIAQNCLPLNKKFAGGEREGKFFAYPWCRGGYALFSLTEDFSQAGETAISCGGENLPQVAAALAGIKGAECPSQEAYVRFLNGEYRYLLGTQRDLCRFASRNVSVYFKPLTEFCDLYQYISLLSAEKGGECRFFLEELLSEQSQEELTSIGMYPVSAKNEFLGDGTHYLAGAFAAAEERETLLSYARAGEIKNLVKFLKTV